MTEEKLIEIFTSGTSGNKYADGQRVLNSDLVTEVDITSEDKLICITGAVISENLFNEYKIKIEYDSERRSILSTYCTCMDFEKNEAKKTNYACKHIASAFYKSLGELLKHPLIELESKGKETSENSKLLLELLSEREENKEEIKLEVYINKKEWKESINAEFRIGLKSMGSQSLYVLKDINQFLYALDNNFEINYSKNFTFNSRLHKLGPNEKRLLNFIEMLKQIESSKKFIAKNYEGAVEGKYLNIPRHFVREFFDIIKNYRVYLNEGFFYRPVETEIFEKAPDIDFDLKIIKDNYVLKSQGGMPESLSLNNDVLLYGTDIYMPDYDYTYKLTTYLKAFKDTKVISFKVIQEEVVLRKLIPDLNSISSQVTLSKTIKDKIVISTSEFSFYFDRENSNISLELKVKYGSYEFNIFEDYSGKVIYRDYKKEKAVKDILLGYGFEQFKGKFYLLKEEDFIFRFFKYEINKLQEIGEVYYSERFKGIKALSSNSFNAQITSGKYNYFELNFKIADIPPQETSGILRAFRENLKFYKLKNGEYIDLEQLELKNLLKIIDAVASKEPKDNHITFQNNKAIYLDSFLEENSIRYIDGYEKLKTIADKVKNISKLEFPVPIDLNGNLREYQKTGYNWFKTLEYLGFGGVLGDEMGLGKTLQAITFILSNKGSKTLIAAPTSLVFNWVSEFEKFAPSVKVAAVNGNVEERKEVLNGIKNYDVLVTTYNLLKRDLNSYKDLYFDYFIIDEAQNIKNSNSQNALTVKEITAKTRFALTGTPIENSLMELWSIFDFIMPGYLYDEKRFSVRYHKRLREEPIVIEEVNRLIKPFILRRKKKEVINELPDKIEKIITVEMEEEQKKVYKTYANYAVELIEKKVKDFEFENSKIEILSYITKLRQICLDPSLLMQEYEGRSGKLEALLEILRQSIDEGHRVLVFSQFTSMLKSIGKRIEAEGIGFSYLDGSVQAKKRMELVNNFNSGENSVFLISLKAGGTGLNLTSADIVVHFDPWWNPSVEEQATDRAHRIGQKHVVEVIKLIAKGTIEEKILKLQESKKQLVSSLLGENLSTGSSFNNLNSEELLKLFSD